MRETRRMVVFPCVHTKRCSYMVGCNAIFNIVHYAAAFYRLNNHKLKRSIHYYAFI